ALAGALGGPLGARLADRYGPRRALVPLLLGHVVGLVTLLAAVHADAPTGVLYAAAVVTGGCLPPVGALTRARWAALATGPDELAAAFAVESLTDDLSYVLGPALATVLGALVSPVAGPVFSAVLVLVGGLSLAVRGTTPRRAAHVPAPAPPDSDATPVRRHALLGPLAVPGVRVLAAAFVGVGVVFSGLSVSVTAFAAAHGHPAAAGPVYSGFGVASMLGGAAYGAVRWRATPERRLLVGFGVLAVGCLTLPAVTGLGALTLAIAMPGLALAPTIIGGNSLVQALAPAGTATEAFAWLGGASGIGIAAGSALTGRIVDGGDPRWGFLVPAVAAATAALVIATARRRLSPP
ncbi:MAG: MFS transporter, partial [Actinocatenispora sp.]